MLVYKFFFLNYVLQVSRADIMESMMLIESGDLISPVASNVPDEPDAMEQA